LYRRKYRRKKLSAKYKAKLEACQDPEWRDSDGEQASEDTIRDFGKKLAKAEKGVSEINEKMAQNEIAVQDLNMKIKETEQKLETLLNFPDAYCEKLKKLEALQKMHLENETQLQKIHTNANDLEDEIKSKTRQLEAMFWEDTVAVRKSALQSQSSQIDQLINDSKNSFNQLVSS
jgi:chromosome segregation ATPase